VKYADDFLVMAREETVTQGMNDRLIEIGRFYVKGKKCGKKKVWRL
jgi:hypothetical protein